MAARLGTLLDQLWKIKLEKEALEKQLGKVRVKYTLKEDQIKQEFKNQKIDMSAGKVARASVSILTQPSMDDHNKLAAFIYRNKALDLLQRRMSKSAWAERLEARNGRPIPGVSSYQQTNLNLRKR